jgi:hypothetical protein
VGIHKAPDGLSDSVFLLQIDALFLELCHDKQTDDQSLHPFIILDEIIDDFRRATTSLRRIGSAARHQTSEQTEIEQIEFGPNGRFSIDLGKPLLCVLT